MSESESILAIDGGAKVRNTSFPTGKRFGETELKYVSEALNQNTLFYFHGQMTKRFLAKFNETIGCQFASSCSSGTAAIHTALGAAGIGAGDEVITTSITDMGTVIGILYQNAVPVFCDNLPGTYGMNVEDMEQKITAKTKAVIVVHLAGNPSDMDAILAVTCKHNLIVIEDCAQSWGCYYKGKHVGTFGHFGCFSTNEFKHISTGDGGVVCTNKEAFYRKAHLFADKNYDRLSSNPRNVESLSPNYRWTELQAAVGLGQLEKLAHITETRRKHGEKLTSMIKGILGIVPHIVLPYGKCSFWFYLFCMDELVLGIDRNRFVECLIAEGLPAGAGYIPHPVYKYPVFQNENFFNNNWPAKQMNMTKMNYKSVSCMEAEKILRLSVRLPISEFYEEVDIEDMGKAILKVANHFLKNKQKQ